MKSITTESFKIALVESFINTIKDSNKYFLQFYSPNKTPLFAIKIKPEDIIQGIPNNKIGYTTDFIAYNKDVTDLYTKKFFGTSEDLYNHAVYKLIDGNGFSNSLPTQTDAIPAQTVDGFNWKYMYSIPSNIAYKFSSNYYVPVIENKSIYNPSTTNKPPNGHGFSILYELAASSIIINTKIKGEIFDNTLVYKSFSIIKSDASDDVLYHAIRAIPNDKNYNPLSVSDEFYVYEGGVIFNCLVESKLKDGTLLISCKDERLLDIIDRNGYTFSKGSYKLVKPDEGDYKQITIDDNKIKTIEKKIKQTIITVIDF